MTKCMTVKLNSSDFSCSFENEVIEYLDSDHQRTLDITAVSYIKKTLVAER